VAGVYISYPFCAQKCTYCNFASGVFPKLEAQYVERLHAELRAAEWPWTPETLYLGGGTPSQMDTADLGSILALVPGRPWREATIEAAPGTLGREKVRAWREQGINRLSLGVQSFVQKELARTGSRHAAATVDSDVRLLRECGIESINVDLIAGLPGQTAASWNQSLEWIEKLSVPHVSIYMLEVDEDSRLGRELLTLGSRYGAREVPGDDEIADFYETAVERLAAMGIERYEISNFAQPGWESIHNLKYWRREPYLGFGSGAHSFDGEFRWQNPETPAEYVANQTRPERAPADHDSEKFFLGLRLTSGIETGALTTAPRSFQAAVERFVGDGLLEHADGRLRLTPRGVLLSNEVFAAFV
jgi:oxygen-independent coproporphyrinogen-3 oxidase